MIFVSTQLRLSFHMEMELFTSVFEFMDNLVKITIPFDDEVMGMIGDNYFDNEPKKTIEELICEFVKSNPKLTKDEIALKLGISRTTITRTIGKSLKIIYVGSKKGGHWEITDEK